MSVTSLMPPGEHTVTATVEYPKGTSLPAKTFKLTINNPLFGKVPPDEDAEALKQQAAGSKVAVLQQGSPTPELKLDNYTGCHDTLLIAPHQVGDRSMAHINFGGSPDIVAGHYGPERRVLIKFDLAAIPKTATVQKALLKLQLQTGGALERTAHRILKPWQGGLGIGDLYDKQRGGIRAGECSWDKRVHPDTAWGAPGCGKAGEDYDAKGVTSACKEAKNVGAKLEKVWVTWDLTEFVQGWVKDPGNNNGVLIIGSDKSPCSHFRSADFEDPIFRPKLVLVFK